MVIGCDRPNIEVVEVTGTVTQNGKPLQEVKVVFSPDPASIPKELLESGTAGQSSQAITDDQGKYRLRYRGDLHDYGAEVGNHIVIAIDVMSENSRDNPIPPRIKREYSVASKSDIYFEVKAGQAATFDFELKPRN